MNSQPIFYCIVDIIYLKKSRGKKPPIPSRKKGVWLVTRAKTIAHINRDKDAIQSIAKNLKIKNYLSLRVYNVVSQKIVGYSAVNKENNYEDEFK
tara:strand:+ start:4309 stop:4593 length:285 start_codon:yes stop_codon:yes gene_type:complete